MAEPNIEIRDMDAKRALSRDPTSKLTEQARTIYRELARRRDRAKDLLRPSEQRTEDARMAFRHAETQYRELEKVYQSGKLYRTTEQPTPFMKRTEEGQRERVTTARRVEPDDARLTREKAALDALEVEWKTLMHERDVRAGEWGDIGGQVADIENWLSDLSRRDVLVDFDGPAPKLPKTQTPYDACISAEAKVSELRRGIEEIEGLPLTGAEAKEQIRAYVEELADVARPDVSAVLGGHGGESVHFARDRQEIFANAVGETVLPVNGFVPVVDVAALCAWLNPDAFAQRLCDEIDALDDGTGMTSEDRAESLAAARAELLSAERQWAHWLTACERNGEHGLRRRGIDPLALLQLEIRRK